MAGWLNRQQQVVIDYLVEENRVLKEQVEGQRLRFTDEQRMRLAVKAKGLGRRLLDELETLVTPDTLLAWHRKLIAQKWTYARKGPGRPRVAQEITDLLLRMARENTSWGYDRIQGALTNVGYVVAPNTVKNILKRHGIKPGLTGLAQVNGRNELGWSDRFRRDLEYLDQVSLWMDIKILFRTVMLVIKREGITSGTSKTMQMSSKIVRPGRIAFRPR